MGRRRKEIIGQQGAYKEGAVYEGKDISNSNEEFQKDVKRLLDRERWQGYVSGKVEWALNVLYTLNVTREERIHLLADAAGLSQATAADFINERDNLK